MSEVINKDALKAKLQKVCTHQCGRGCTLCKVIDTFPVHSEAPKGKWKTSGRKYPGREYSEEFRHLKWVYEFHCSVCSHYAIFKRGERYDFCPYCGADMREERT